MITEKYLQAKVQEQVCDLSAINMQTPDQPIELSCTMLFTCDTITVDAKSVSITADQVYLGDGATLRNVPPAKAAKVIINDLKNCY